VKTFLGFAGVVIVIVQTFHWVLISAHLADIQEELKGIRDALERIADVQECQYDER
jgi:hypothetical protein